MCIWNVGQELTQRLVEDGVEEGEVVESDQTAQKILERKDYSHRRRRQKSFGWYNNREVGRYRARANFLSLLLF